MTYGQPVGAYPYPPRRPGRGGLLFARSAQHPQKLFLIGIGLAVASLLLIIFSALTWTVAEEELSSVDLTVTTSLSGVGSASIDIDGDSDYLSGSDIRKFERKTEKDTNSPGAWTITFGVLLGIASAGLMSRRAQPVFALGAAVTGVAAFITATVFFADPADAIVDSWSDISESVDYFERAYGIWFVFVGGIIGLLCGLAAVSLVLFPEKFRPEQPQGLGSYGHPQPPMVTGQYLAPPRMTTGQHPGPPPTVQGFHQPPTAAQGWQPIPPQPPSRGQYDQTQIGEQPPPQYGSGYGQ